MSAQAIPARVGVCGVATAADSAALRTLWMRCFGDSEDYVNKYFSAGFVPENVFVLRREAVEAMAISFPVRWVSGDGDERDGAYLYAVCTAPEARGNGHFRTLTAFAEQTLAARGATFVCLRPADGALAATYARMGYLGRFTLRESVVKADCSYVNLASIDAGRYGLLRQLQLRGGFIDYPPETLAQQARLGPLYEVSDGDRFGVCAAERTPGGWLVKEFLGDEALLPGLCRALDAAQLSVRTPGDEQVFALSKALDGGPCPTGYLGLAFD